jgi:tRNA-splicing ligase RtcB
MFDTSVIVEGVESDSSKQSLYSTVHGAGRVMSRRKALGKTKWTKAANGTRKLIIVQKGVVDFDQTREEALRRGIVLRGSGADESPECYKKLDQVLDRQGETIKVLHRLEPIAVAMAGAEIFDPYKD